MKSIRILRLSIISSVLVILYMFFQWKLIDLITLFLILPVLLFVFGFFFVITIGAVITLFKNKEWKPIVIQAFTILLLFLVPFNQIVLDTDFKFNQSQREHVVELVKSGELKPNVSYNDSLIHLPLKYRHLSSGGGEIEVIKVGKDYNILFFTFRGMLDNFSGFVYTSDGERPSGFNAEFIEVEKLDEHWYFVSAS